MANVRRLVGINAGMFDENFSRRNVYWWLPIGRRRRGHPGPIDLHIEIAGSCDLHLRNALNGTDLSSNRLGKFERSRAQRLGEGEKRDGKISQFDLRRLFDDNLRQRCPGITALQKLYNAVRQALFQITIQGFPLRV